MHKRPFYHFNDFKKACLEKTNIVPINTVLQDAKRDFNINNVDMLLDFIGNDGLETLNFVNMKEWDKNPNIFEILVDAYTFMTLGRLGYLAFFKNDKTKKWIIKSFHLSDTRNKVMEQALLSAGIDPNKYKGK